MLHVCSTKPLNCMNRLEDILEIYDEDCITEENQEFELEGSSQEEEVTSNHEEGILVQP